jgi:hypothetical protein
MSTSERPADSPIREECWEDFCRDYEVVWDQLVYLRTSLYLLRQIAAFPLRRLVSLDDQWFLTVAGRALYEAVVLGVTKLVTDQKGDLLTLRQWRNRVRDMLLPQRLDEYQGRLDETRLNREAEALARLARDFRDGHVAHLRLEDVRKASVDSPVLRELDRLVAETERLFQPLLFGGGASFLPPIYDPSVRAANPPGQTDIEKILTFMAQGSYVLNEPELHPQTWPYRRANLTGDDLTTFNEWRVRIGKDPV